MKPFLVQNCATFVRAMSSASVTDWRSVIFSVGPGTKAERMERTKCVKMSPSAMLPSTNVGKCYHLQGLASLAQTGNGQHGRWLKKGWVVIWKDFSSTIDLDIKRGRFSPAKEARGAPDSRSGHVSSNNCCPLLQLLLTLKRLFFIFFSRKTITGWIHKI